MSRKVVWALLALNALLIGVIGFMVPRVVMRVKMPAVSDTMPVIARISPFTLIRENGTEFRSDSELAGRPWIASFIFTRCPGQCPIMSGKLAVLQGTMPEAMRIVSISVDPEYDSPQMLQEYARRFGADPGRWIHLTGDKQTISRIQNELKLSASEDPGMHSLRFVLVDGRGDVRAYYDSTDPSSLEKLKKDVRKEGLS